MNPRIAPCKGCTDRHTACHDQCAKYAQWKADVHKVTAVEKEYKRKLREDFLMSEQCDSNKEKWRLGRKYGRK